ncbi:universal stress protein [Aquincola sp. MAHUQ-54]|uniref:Universal stress protein n=1 Tax=Aquincola agrisoli TaxID=3119538 RepID=A0AAW9Q7X9_9BURK
MSLRQVLAVVDLSPAGIHAAWRAARVAWAQGAALRLLALVELPYRHPLFGPGSAAPFERARAELSHLADEIAASIGLRPEVVVGTHEDEAAAWRAHARGAGLVVVPGEPAGLRLAGWLHGGLAERVLRQAGTPVFIARRPSGTVHRRVLAVVDADLETAGPVLRAAQWFCRPEALLACHVLDPAIQRHLAAADLPLPAIHAWMDTAVLRARAALADQLGRAELPAARAVVLRGPALPQLVGEQQRSGASLVVVTKPRRAWWADLARPSLGRQLADRVACDVLWLPTPAPSARAARQRLALHAASE